MNPVVVRPLVDSKMASGMPSIPDSTNGMAYTTTASTQMSVVTPAASTRVSVMAAAPFAPK